MYTLHLRVNPTSLRLFVIDKVREYVLWGKSPTQVTKCWPLAMHSRAPAWLSPPRSPMLKHLIRLI